LTPELDVVKGAMITNCVAFMPAILGMVMKHEASGLFPESVMVAKK
jgi:hypothetical protein